MADFSSLKNQILDDIKQNKTVAMSQQKINAQLKNGTANYKSAADFSKSLGIAVSDSFSKNVTNVAVDELGAFVREVVAPVYGKTQKTMLSVCSKVQNQINNNAGLNINPVEVKQDVSRIQHIIERFEEASSFDEVSFLLGENVAQSVARGAVSNSIKENAEFQKESGLNIVLSRYEDSLCCDFCKDQCGNFHSFKELPKHFWSIHRNCSCIIDYKVGKHNIKIKYLSEKNGKIIKSIENADTSITIDREKYVGKEIKKGDDQSVREWYYANVHDIINQIDETKPFEEQVREAYKLRIKYKHEARVAMYDRQKAEKLEKKFPAVSFEELLRDKMRRKNISKEDALNDILITASTTNQKVDDLYILGD